VVGAWAVHEAELERLGRGAGMLPMLADGAAQADGVDGMFFGRAAGRKLMGGSCPPMSLGRCGMLLHAAAGMKGEPFHHLE
jgi:hypothetical protein